MARVVVAWELGGGLGHLARVRPVARGLQQRGHDVVLALRNPDVCATGPVNGDRIARVAAPYRPPDPRPPLSITYADHLRRNGYGTRDSTRALLDEWLALLDRHSPDLVVAEHAPGALLAARHLGIKRLAIGSGFTAPPLDVPQPTLQPWFEVPAEERLRREHQLLAVLNAVLGDRGGTPFGAVADLFENAGPLLCTFRELDHYAERTTGSYVGPVFGLDGHVVSRPHGSDRHIFFYGAGPRLYELVDAASARGHAVVAYNSRRRDHQPAASGSRAMWLSRPADLDALADTCQLAVCEAPGTATRFLLRGIPVMLLPRQLEQQMWAHRVTRQGLAVAVGLFAPMDAAGVTRVFEDALGDEALRGRTNAFAARHAGFDVRRAASRVVDRCDELLTCR